MPGVPLMERRRAQPWQRPTSAVAIPASRSRIIPMICAAAQRLYSGRLLRRDEAKAAFNRGTRRGKLSLDAFRLGA